MEKSVIWVTCHVIPNAMKRVSSVWNDYQTHIWVRQNRRQKVIDRGYLRLCRGGLDIKI